MIIGKQYKVKSDHKFWPGFVGVFEFLGGPEANVVVLCIKETKYSKEYACVDIKDIE